MLSNYVVVSLGTNDPPTAVTAFRQDVARVLELVGPNRCVVWATIWRDERPNDAFNDVLRDAARANRRVRLVEWAEMVEQNPELARPGRAPRQRGRVPRARPGGRGGRQELRSGPVGDARVTEPVGLVDRRRDPHRETTLRRSPSFSSTVARPVPCPGTWSATSELLATELAPRFPGARVRRGALPGQDLERARLVPGRRSGRSRPRRPADAPRRLLDGRCGVDRRLGAPVRRRRARARPVDSRSGCPSRGSSASASTSSTAPGIATSRAFQASAPPARGAASIVRARSAIDGTLRADRAWPPRRGGEASIGRAAAASASAGLGRRRGRAALVLSGQSS